MSPSNKPVSNPLAVLCVGHGDKLVVHTTPLKAHLHYDLVCQNPAYDKETVVLFAHPWPEGKEYHEVIASARNSFFVHQDERAIKKRPGLATFDASPFNLPSLTVTTYVFTVVFVIVALALIAIWRTT